MKIFKQCFFAFFLLAAILCVCTVGFGLNGFVGVLAFLIGLLAFVILNIYPSAEKTPNKRLRQLSQGNELLRQFIFTTLVNSLYVGFRWLEYIKNFAPSGKHTDLKSNIILTLLVILLEAVVFWNGMIRVYVTSVQLGIKHRVLAALCGCIPILNIIYLVKIIRITSDEVKFEKEKSQTNEVRAESEICKTKYPILLVHGVFFRDFRYLNYWGRIPKELKRNGAVLFYGEQQSAASVEESGKELALRIKHIVEETNCGKVNIIAHSKGGLDSRAAISHYGMSPYVATLTTINTPHRGCIFAEYLLSKIPEKVRQNVASVYNSTLKRLGDGNPDFLAAVIDLTESACLARNETTPDSPEVVYESTMSYCKKAQNGKFPLNMTYPIVKHFDGLNDGLVSVESAKWGSDFTLLTPKGNRGISHGDMIDLNRENISGFDVREYYVSLVSHLKERGF